MTANPPLLGMFGLQVDSPFDRYAQPRPYVMANYTGYTPTKSLPRSPFPPACHTLLALSEPEMERHQRLRAPSEPLLPQFPSARHGNYRLQHYEPRGAPALEQLHAFQLRRATDTA
jgi:hypothetical protein